MDNIDRAFEEEMLDIIRLAEGGAPEGGEEEVPITDGSEFLNNDGEGMERPEQTDEAQTSADFDDDDHNVEHVVTKSGEVY